MALRGKRGSETILYFRIICVVLAVGLFIVILSFVIDAAKDTLIKKTYMSKDMALLITTVYASPGNVVYYYPLSGAFTIKISGSQVSVSDTRGEIVYWYSRPSDMEDIKIYETGNEIPEIAPPTTDGTLDGKNLVFKKVNDVVTAEVV
jgi:hypothetical protein